jgi:hypothetical protein
MIGTLALICFAPLVSAQTSADPGRTPTAGREVAKGSMADSAGEQVSQRGARRLLDDSDSRQLTSGDVFAPATKGGLSSAVTAWLTDSSAAMVTYGDIST